MITSADIYRESLLREALYVSSNLGKTAQKLWLEHLKTESFEQIQNFIVWQNEKEEIR